MNLLPQSFRKLLRVNIPDGKIRQEAYEEITRSLIRAFSLPSLRTYASTLSIKGLLVKSVQFFVGSREIPKNIQLSRYLMNVAETKTNDDKIKDEIEYYKYFFLRIDAFKNGKTAEFDLTTEVLNKLAEEKGHPQSCYLVGKQLYNVAVNSTNEEERRQLFKLAVFYFEKSLSDNQYGGLFYLGDIFRSTQYTEIQAQQFNQLFVYGAAMGDPMCYFRMSQIYSENKNVKLYLKYLKLAAESGIIEAQHNLGCQYLQGKNMAKNEIKALAWFMHAAANGFVQSKFNVVHIFLNGSSCGRIKKNKKVALLKLQELKSMGEQVDAKIKQILESDQIKKVIAEQQTSDKQIK